MKRTNYLKIADKYDKNSYRQNIKLDEDLNSIFNSFKGSKFRVLDLACGTGLYLSNQIKHYMIEEIEWHGLDASEAMLAKAKEKVEDVHFIKALAEEMPYDSNYFNFVINNYAFHHFIDKSKALDEIERIIDTGGIFKMHNISIHDMRRWWIYQYFPSAYYEDLKRFWQKELIFKELSVRGFEVELRLDYTYKEIKVSELVGYVENRDISILTLIDDKEYMEGLERIQYEISKNPEAKIIGDFADLFIIAKKL